MCYAVVGRECGVLWEDGSIGQGGEGEGSGDGAFQVGELM